MSVVKKSKTNLSECQICGVPTSLMNFGVLSCSSCKMFFKRNAELQQEHFKCRYDGHCEVNINNRHVCSCCRLKKCFSSGMRIEFLRPSRKRSGSISGKRKINSIISNDRDQPKQLTTLNLLQSDKSLLNTNQWTLLSNLIHNYDESKLFSIAQLLMNENNVLQIIEMSNPIQTAEFFKETYETSGAYLRANGDLAILPSDTRSGFLRSAAESVVCLSTIFIWNQSQLYIHQPFLNTCRHLYGEQSVAMVHHVMKHIDPDVALVKLALSLFAFSDSVLIFSPYVTMKSNNSSLIFHIQNTYAEVTWKYLVYKYGYYQAIIRFNNLIQCLLAATDTVSRSQNVQIHTNDMESLVEQTEISLVLADID